MKKHFHQFNRGFTLIELIISIFILSVAIVGIFSSFSIIVILTANATDRLTATYLAQEGMEIVRNIRDTNWLNMDSVAPNTTTYSWLDDLSTAGIPPYSIDCTNGCEADYTTTSVIPTPAGIFNMSTNFDYLKLSTAGFYNYTTGTPTRFKRKIVITCLPDGQCATDPIIKVVVLVSWDQKATILNPYAAAGSPDPTDPTNVAKCNPLNCFTMETTMYDWYNYVNPIH